MKTIKKILIILLSLEVLILVPIFFWDIHKSSVFDKKMECQKKYERLLQDHRDLSLSGYIGVRYNPNKNTCEFESFVGGEKSIFDMEGLNQN